MSWVFIVAQISLIDADFDELCLMSWVFIVAQISLMDADFR